MLWSKLRLRSMIQTLKDVEFGIRAKIHSWSTIRRILEIRKFAQFITKARHPCPFEGQFRRSVNLFTSPPALIVFLHCFIDLSLVIALLVSLAAFLQSLRDLKPPGILSGVRRVHQNTFDDWLYWSFRNRFFSHLLCNSPFPLFLSKQHLVLRKHNKENPCHSSKDVLFFTFFRNNLSLKLKTRRTTLG